MKQSTRRVRKNTTSLSITYIVFRTLLTLHINTNLQIKMLSIIPDHRLAHDPFPTTQRQPRIRIRLKRVVATHATATVTTTSCPGRFQPAVAANVVVAGVNGSAASAFGGFHDGGFFPHEGTSIEVDSVSILDLGLVQIGTRN